MTKSNFAMFLLGAISGSAGAWLYLKKHYAQIAQEEIDSVKAVYSSEKKDEKIENTEPTKENQIQKADTDDNKPKPKDLKPDILEYAAKIQEERYAASEEQKKGKEEEMIDKPYVISPDDFGEFYDYNQISLTYYEDGVVADDMDEIVDDVDGILGVDFDEHFGDYDEDSVCIRNDRLKSDYEIVKDARLYADVVSDSEY